MTSAPRLVVGISGASGAVYGIRMLQALRALGVESHLVLSKAAEMTVAYETDWKVADVKALADVCHPVQDVGAAISSGRSEEHTSELQSLMRISYAVFCLKKKN